MPFINCKIHLELIWTKDCVMSDIAGAATFKTTNTKLYVPTLSAKDNVNLTKQLNEGFKRPVYLNEYKSKIESKKQITILQDFILMLHFNELKDYMFFPLITLK